MRAVGYAELFVLARDDILKALKDHPEAEVILGFLSDYLFRYIYHLLSKRI